MRIHCALLAEKPVPLMHKHRTAQHVTRNSYYGGIGETKLRNKAGDKYIDKDGNETTDEGKAVNAGSIGRPIHTSDYGKNFGITRGMTWVGGAQYTYDFDHFLFMPAQLLAGAEYSSASRTRCL